jgi:beta-glucosidase
MGREVDAIRKYAKDFVSGVQGCSAEGTWDGVLGSTKHFLGDGATYLGIDEGNTTVHDYKQFLHDNYQGYGGSIESGIGNIMVSYSAINRIPMSINSALLEGVLKEG